MTVMLSPEELNTSIRTFWRAVWPAVVPLFAFVLFSAQIVKWLSSHHYALGLPVNSPFLILVPLITLAEYFLQRGCPPLSAHQSTQPISLDTGHGYIDCTG
jgi:hypothetical protein